MMSNGLSVDDLPDVISVAEMTDEDALRYYMSLSAFFCSCLINTHGKEMVMEALERHDIVFAVGKEADVSISMAVAMLTQTESN